MSEGKNQEFRGATGHLYQHKYFNLKLKTNFPKHITNFSQFYLKFREIYLNDAKLMTATGVGYIWESDKA